MRRYGRRINRLGWIIIIIGTVLLIGTLINFFKSFITGIKSGETWAIVLLAINAGGVVALITLLVVKIVKSIKGKRQTEDETAYQEYYNNTQDPFAKQAIIYNDGGLQNNEVSYSQKSSMTACEMRFWEQLKRLFADDYIITPQVPLSSIVRKNADMRYANELYRTIDFGLFTKEDYSLVALIEINDSTHHESSRIARDYKVKAILAQAGISDKLITLWTDMPNTDEYILRRVTEIAE